MGNIKDIYTSLILHIISQMLENSLSEILIKCGLNLVGEITPENAIRVGKGAIHECGISLKFERLRKLYAPYCSVASVYYYSYNDDKSGWIIK